MTKVDELVEFEIEKLLAKIGFKNFHINQESNANKGDNYLGVIHFITITGENEFDEPEKLHVVVKCAETEESKRNFVPMKRIYEREIYCYQEIFPAFIKLQKEFQVNKPFACFAKSLSASMLDNAEMIIFENLKPLGYGLWNRMEPMDENHLNLVLKEYGRLHAFSFAMKEKDPTTYKQLTSKFDNILESVGEQMQRPIEMAYNSCVSALEDGGHVNAIEALKTVEKYFKSVFSLGCCEEESSVIVHGDGWCNNFMFKYSDSNPKIPSGMCFLDFQISRIASPVVDLSYFLYSSASKKSLDNFDNLLRVYYDSLSSFLGELECDAEELFPFAVLKEHWKIHAKYGFIMSFVLLRMMHFESDEAPDLNEEAMVKSLNQSMKEEKKYRKRLTDVVLHFVEKRLL